MSYFFDEAAAARIDDQIAEVSVWRDTEARQIAERVLELGPRDRNTVTSLIDSLRAYDRRAPGSLPRLRRVEGGRLRWMSSAPAASNG